MTGALQLPRCQHTEVAFPVSSVEGNQGPAGSIDVSLRHHHLRRRASTGQDVACSAPGKETACEARCPRRGSDLPGCFCSRGSLRSPSGGAWQRPQWGWCTVSECKARHLPPRTRIHRLCLALQTTTSSPYENRPLWAPKPTCIKGSLWGPKTTVSEGPHDVHKGALTAARQGASSEGVEASM